VCREWRFVFSMETHGASLRSLYEQCKHASGPCLVLCVDSWSYIFGAFVNEPLRPSSSASYGTGESFLFTFEPEWSVFPWTSDNDVFLSGDSKRISIGGGADGAGFSLDSDLLNGASHHSATFGNRCLASAENFTCIQLEVWCLGKMR